MIRPSNHWKSRTQKVPTIGTFSVPKFQSLEHLSATKINKAVPGFTVLELLVVIALIGLLAVLVLPALGSARGNSARAACASNLRQLALANIAYAADHGHFVAAAPDIRGRNNTRWHGARTSRNEPFDPANGPLSPYFGKSKRVKECPSFRPPDDEGFEQGCGGYGYNACGVGSQAYLVGAYAGAATGMPVGVIANAAQTVMFTDAAFLQGDTLIEYSFAEPVFNISSRAPPRESFRAQPSIHFRHDGHANVAWADGHVTLEPVRRHGTGGFAEANIGWFGPDDNSLFDPF